MLQALLAQTLASFWLPERASTLAPAYDALFYFILAINIFFSTLIMALLILFVLRYRHREGHHANPTGGHSTALELTWTIIPTLLVLVIFYYGFRGYLHENTMPPNAYEITANGSMWKWNFVYPTGLSHPELHLILNRPTRMVLQSADVIHDLDIPEFRIKKDAVPGRFNRSWFEPTKITEPEKLGLTLNPGGKLEIRTVEEKAAFSVYGSSSHAAIKSIDLTPGDTYGFQLNKDGKLAGVYTQSGVTTEVPLEPKSAAESFSWKYYGYFQIYCAMYCGQNHSVMLAHCVVHPDQADFDAWMKNQTLWEPNMSYVDRGKQLYHDAGCSTCHTVDGNKAIGPSWKDLWGSSVPLEGHDPVTADDDYLKESIVAPSAKIVKGFGNLMPNNFSSMPPNDIAALTWYMKSISANYKGDMTPGTTVGAALNGGAGATPPTTQPAAVPGTPPKQTP